MSEWIRIRVKDFYKDAVGEKDDKNQKKVISSLKLIELIRREIREAQIVLIGDNNIILICLL